MTPHNLTIQSIFILYSIMLSTIGDELAPISEVRLLEDHMDLEMRSLVQAYQRQQTRVLSVMESSNVAMVNVKNAVNWANNDRNFYAVRHSFLLSKTLVNRITLIAWTSTI